MNLAGKKVLVTGADGFIGSHLVESLLAQGCDVTAFTYYNAFNQWGWLDSLDEHTLEQINVVSGDIRDAHFVSEAVKSVDVVFHLAALIAIPYSYHAPESYLQTNVQGTLNVLQAARAHEIERVVHTSTSEVYGSAQTVPITEQHRLHAQSPYAASKVAADQFALSYYAAFDCPVTTVRPFNTYGPRQSARAIIPTIIAQIAAGQRTLHLGNVTPTRDFSYVQDTVDGFIAMAASDQGIGDVTNLGSNFEVSILDTVKCIAEVMNVEVEIIAQETRVRPAKSEVERLWADNSNALRLSEWRPQYTGLEGFKRGLEATVVWFTQPENLARYKALAYNL